MVFSMARHATLLLPVAFAGLYALPACAAKQSPLPIRVTVEQFEQFLSAPHHPRDSKFAEQLAGYEITQRAGSARLARWLLLVTGKRSRQVVMALADFSAFEDLPAADLTPEPTPGIETQRAIFARVIDYVVRTRARLPDFSALRSTTRFVVAAPRQIRLESQTTRMFGTDQEKPDYMELGRARSEPDGGRSLFVTPTSSRFVTYRDGHEVSSNGDASSASLQPHLNTVGEFGPILSVVLGDAMHGNVSWDHWEPGIKTHLAVFRYSVPKEVSHYAVQDSASVASFPAYSGEIAVDPDTGAIIRITLSAEQGSVNSSESGIVVEYGPVEIAGKTYICPIHSVAFWRAMPDLRKGVAPAPEQVQMDQEEIFLNDVSFTNYHVFRSEMRILP